MLTFYFAPGSSSMAPHIALHETGAQFEAKPISFWKKEQRSPKYLAINPDGKVPTLVIDGRPLTEVAGILYYIARRFPDAALMPEDIEEQSQIISWLSFNASRLHPARSQGRDIAFEVTGLADRKLGARDWVVQTYSIADIHLFRLYWRFRDLFKPAPETFPNLERHNARMMQRAAVQKTIAIESAIGYEFPENPPAGT